MEREASLLRNFVENMALWVRVKRSAAYFHWPNWMTCSNASQADITDPYRHFESEVPARALKEPVLRCALFAFSSRHLNRQDDSDVAEALQYHNQCVQLLIPALSKPELITEDFLAAVAILRQHEEMDGRSFSCCVETRTHAL